MFMCIARQDALLHDIAASCRSGSRPAIAPSLATSYPRTLFNSASNAMRVSFIGLGVMGYPMAGYLAKSGHDVCVYHRTADKAERWLSEFEGRAAATPAEASENAEIAFTCVGNDDDVRSVVLSDSGVLSAIPSGSLIVDHTTASAVIEKEIYAAAGQKSVGFLDAPLSGGQAGAESGQLTIMVGGDQDQYQRALPAMDCYAKACTLIGSSGACHFA